MSEYTDHCIPVVIVGLLALLFALLGNTATIRLDTEDFVRSVTCSYDVKNDPHTLLERNLVTKVGEFVQLEYDLEVAKLGVLDCVFNLEIRIDNTTDVTNSYTLAEVQVRPRRNGGFDLTSKKIEVSGSEAAYYRDTRRRSKDSILGSVLQLFPPVRDITVKQSLRFVSKYTVELTVAIWEMGHDSSKASTTSMLLTVPELDLGRKVTLRVMKTLGEFNRQCLESLYFREICTPVVDGNAVEDNAVEKRSSIKTLAWAVPLGIGLIAAVGLLFFLFWHKIYPPEKVLEDGSGSCLRSNSC